ncbi:unnamed protein product [Colias eurytheme]|nr:unnamed protein product [Colias eurytheme]
MAAKLISERITQFRRDLRTLSRTHSTTVETAIAANYVRHNKYFIVQVPGEYKWTKVICVNEQDIHLCDEDKNSRQSPTGKMCALDNKYHKRRSSTITKKRHPQGELLINKEYGEQCTKPDVSDTVLQEMKKNFLSNLQKSEEERRKIERSTVLQSESSEWLELRRTLLTASNFGRVIKMRADTSCTSIVKQLLYKLNIDVAPVRYGKENEKKKALDQLCVQEGVEISPCGLFIDPEIPYLGATPDGLIGEDMIVEIKCPISAHNICIRRLGNIDKKTNFWIKEKTGEFKINQQHNCARKDLHKEESEVDPSPYKRRGGFIVDNMIYSIVTCMT